MRLGFQRSVLEELCLKHLGLQCLTDDIGTDLFSLLVELSYELEIYAKPRRDKAARTGFSPRPFS